MTSVMYQTLDITYRHNNTVTGENKSSRITPDYLTPKDKVYKHMYKLVLLNNMEIRKLIILKFNT